MPPDSDQFELFEPGTCVVRIPWGGKSPRGLTKVGLSSIFKAQAAKERSTIHVDPRQYDLFVRRMGKAAFRYSGAQLLLPLGG